MATTTSNATPTPAMPPPAGSTSNLDQPASLKGRMDIAMSIAIPLTTTFFLLRTYVRIWKRQWIVEDCERFPFRKAQDLWEWVTGSTNKQNRARLNCMGELRLSVAT